MRRRPRCVPSARRSRSGEESHSPSRRCGRRRPRRAIPKCSASSPPRSRRRAGACITCRRARATTAWPSSPSPRSACCSSAARAASATILPRPWRSRTSPPARACLRGSLRRSRRRARRLNTMTDAAGTIHAFLAAHRGDAERFLAELVKVPSDNPPGDCAPHARARRNLLEALGFTVERHVVPEAAVQANGMMSCTNLVVRVRFGPGKGPVVALNAHGDVVPPGAGWTVDPYAAEVRDGTCTAAAPQCRSRISRPTRTRCWRCAMRRRMAQRSTAPSSCTSPTTRKWAARSARSGCCRRRSWRLTS